MKPCKQLKACFCHSAIIYDKPRSEICYRIQGESDFQNFSLLLDDNSRHVEKWIHSSCGVSTVVLCRLMLRYMLLSPPNFISRHNSIRIYLLDFRECNLWTLTTFQIWSSCRNFYSPLDMRFSVTQAWNCPLPHQKNKKYAN